MKQLVSIFIALALGAGASGAWYWPFSSDDEKPPRVSELMEEASIMIDEAYDLAADGKTSEAVDKFREALAELDRIEAENPDRVKEPEFNTLKNKRATVTAAIDSLLLDEVQSNAKAISVTDTTELQKKYDAKMAAKRGGAADVPREEVDEERPKTRPVEESAPSAADAPRSNLEKAMAALKAKDYDAVERAVSEMLSENAKDSVALNLLAAAEIAKGDAKSAEKTLDLAISANPGSYYAYYNMARLMVRAKGNKEAAKRYYETGRRYGGPKDAALEGMLK
jgi:tetratricopeptide (TPR) repeat protein